MPPPAAIGAFVARCRAAWSAERGGRALLELGANAAGVLAVAALVEVLAVPLGGRRGLRGGPRAGRVPRRACGASSRCAAAARLPRPPRRAGRPRPPRGTPHTTPRPTPRRPPPRGLPPRRPPRRPPPRPAAAMPPPRRPPRRRPPPTRCPPATEAPASESERRGRASAVASARPPRRARPPHPAAATARGRARRRQAGPSQGHASRGLGRRVLALAEARLLLQHAHEQVALGAAPGLQVVSVSSGLPKANTVPHRPCYALVQT